MPDSHINSMSSKQIQFARREQDILSSALSLFEGPHWEQVTVEQISKKAEIGKGTVYKHFSCKEEIYAHINIAFTKRLLDAFRTIVNEADILESLKKIIRTAFDIFLDNPAEARVAFYCKREDYQERLSPELQTLFSQLDEEFEQFFHELLQMGIDQGKIPDKPIEHLIMGLEATFDGAISMIWNQNMTRCHREDLDSYVTVISEYMLAGLLGLR